MNKNEEIVGFSEEGDGYEHLYREKSKNKAVDSKLILANFGK
jgi:hypothetical protein